MWLVLCTQTPCSDTNGIYIVYLPRYTWAVVPWLMVYSRLQSVWLQVVSDLYCRMQMNLSTWLILVGLWNFTMIGLMLCQEWFHFMLWNVTTIQWCWRHWQHWALALIVPARYIHFSYYCLLYFVLHSMHWCLINHNEIPLNTCHSDCNLQLFVSKRNTCLIRLYNGQIGVNVILRIQIDTNVFFFLYKKKLVQYITSNVVIAHQSLQID